MKQLEVLKGALGLQYMASQSTCIKPFGARNDHWRERERSIYRVSRSTGEATGWMEGKMFVMSVLCSWSGWRISRVKALHRLRREETVCACVFWGVYLGVCVWVSVVRVRALSCR